MEEATVRRCCCDVLITTAALVGSRQIAKRPCRVADETLQLARYRRASNTPATHPRRL